METRYRELRKVSLVSIAVNVVLACAKMAAGVLGRSTAVISDGVHTLSDVLTTLVVLLGLRFAGKEADENHPYGHQRIESLVSVLIGLLLGLTALYLGWQGARGILTPLARPSLLALAVTLASVVVKEWMFRYTKSAAEQHNSPALLGDAWHHRSDAASSLAVLVGVAGSWAGLWFLDGIAAIVVCIVVLKAAWDIVSAAASQLVDQAAGADIQGRIQELALSVRGVQKLDLLQTRLSGGIIFVDLEVAVDPVLSVEEGHLIAHLVHDLVENSGMPVGHCMVHINPGTRLLPGESPGTI